ncbi:MAG TPA: ABC transporter substrate-binding protein, partial [Nitriliruptorales bacterium]
RRLEAIGMPNIHMQLPAPIPGDWQHSFGISMDHVSQGRAIASFFQQDLQGAKVGFVREQTNALKPGTDAFTAKARELGMEVVVEETIDPNAGDYTALANRICQSGATAVWLYMAPIPANSIMGQTVACNPTWFANSVSWNFDIAVKQVTDPAYAFSPWAAVTSPRADDFKAAWRAEYGSDPQDDVGFVGWSVDTVLHAMLQGAGADLGWTSFEASIRRLQRGGSAEWVPLDFTGGGINGTNAVFVFKLENQSWRLQGDVRRY